MPTAIIGRAALLDALATLLNNATYTVHLFVNNFSPTVDSSLASFTEADYDTYPVGGISPTLPTYGSFGNQAIMSAVSVVFPAPLTGGNVLAYGFYVVFQPSFVAGGNKPLVMSRFGAAPRILNPASPPLQFTINFGDLDLNNP